MEVQNYDKITDKLLPCPFCGGTPVWYRKGNDYTKSQTIIVKCPKCRIERKDAILNNHGHTIEWLEEVAIKNWNQRAFIAGAEWQKEQMIEKAWNWIEDNLLSSNQQDKSRLYFEQFKNYIKE